MNSRISGLAAAALLALPLVATSAELATTTVQPATIAVEHVLDGTLEAIKESTVSAQTSGRIEALPFDVDDFVEKGEVIVRIRDKEQATRVERARAGLEEARARHEEARSEYKRVRDVFEQDLVSRSALDRAKANFESAEARLESARAALEEAREQLERTVVRAPYSGIVTARHVELGETANPGQPLMTGLSLEHLRAVVNVPQRVISEVRENRRARMLLPGGESIEATEVRVFPQADAATHTFTTRVKLPEGQHGVWPGMLVKVAFAAGEEERLLVPHDAVARRSEVSGVYVVEKDGLSFRQVRVGRKRADGRIPVLAGLAAGEEIALDPVDAAIALKRSGDGEGADE